MSKSLIKHTGSLKKWGHFQKHARSLEMWGHFQKCTRSKHFQNDKDSSQENNQYDGQSSKEGRHEYTHWKGIFEKYPMEKSNQLDVSIKRYFSPNLTDMFQLLQFQGKVLKIQV